MGVKVHPTAIVGEKVEIGEGTTIGPYVIIEDGAVLGEDNELNAYSYLFGSVRMGSRNRLMRGASLGGEPQSWEYKGESTRLLVGSDNWFGENLTIHRGTVDTGETVVGDHNFLMAYIHVGHDCRLGDNIVMANDSKLGGHAVIMDGVNLGAGVGVHQRVRVGPLVLAAALARVIRDAMPFTVVRKDDTLFGINRLG
ncbi:MAG: acyl-[acyl-carrier-protein]--UDP-N-acetylglucosamine O-acyltransferase, partial [SAR324 cluster bacterium]|nr:acyl-[acyl-carrier-protein]--UDP-N-acetylglucosamine O-acyltransferase [SAR324 cluster bacterium]